MDQQERFRGTASSLTDRDIPDIVVGLIAAIRYIFTCSRMRLVTEGCLQESQGNCEQDSFWEEEKIRRPLCTDDHLSRSDDRLISASNTTHTVEYLAAVITTFYHEHGPTGS
jgi:hypothetical protein